MEPITYRLVPPPEMVDMLRAFGCVVPESVTFDPAAGYAAEEAKKEEE